MSWKVCPMCGAEGVWENEVCSVCEEDERRRYLEAKEDQAEWDQRARDEEVAEDFTKSLKSSS